MSKTFKIILSSCIAIVLIGVVFFSYTTWVRRGISDSFNNNVAILNANNSAAETYYIKLNDAWKKVDQDKQLDLLAAAKTFDERADELEKFSSETVGRKSELQSSSNSDITEITNIMAEVLDERSADISQISKLVKGRSCQLSTLSSLSTSFNTTKSILTGFNKGETNEETSKKILSFSNGLTAVSADHTNYYNCYKEYFPSYIETVQPIYDRDQTKITKLNDLYRDLGLAFKDGNFAKVRETYVQIGAEGDFTLFIQKDDSYGEITKSISQKIEKSINDKTQKQQLLEDKYNAILKKYWL
jgi:hypothetical protein